MKPSARDGGVAVLSCRYAGVQGGPLECVRPVKRQKAHVLVGTIVLSLKYLYQILES